MKERRAIPEPVRRYSSFLPQVLPGNKPAGVHISFAYGFIVTHTTGSGRQWRQEFLCGETRA